MRDFNLLTEVIKKSIRLGKNYHLLGKSGDHTEMKRDWKTHEPHEKITQALVLIVNQKDNYLEWKTIYRSTKGFYIKLHGNIYIEF
jgi:hypothetical protein